MHLTAAILLVAPLAILASPLHHKRAGPPSVTIANGTVVGFTTAGIDSFFGIPFAEPPVGPLRLKSPEPLQASFTTFTATDPSPTACPQGINGPMGEDCLNLVLIRPSPTATPSPKLPVLVFIYGGGFEGGANTNLNGSFYVEQSVTKGFPFIWVAMNYRIGGFGFLGGVEMQQDGSTNLGLRDQRFALEWVQDNIGAFGGDPDKVTIWGGSAGSISVMDQTIINRGDNSYNGGSLFRAGIQGSGSILPAAPVTSTRAQQLYDEVVSLSGCTGAASTLDCLRTVPFLTLLEASFEIITSLNYQPFDFPYIPRPDPSSDFFPSSPDDAIIAGEFTRVPIITGDVEDEGTAFTGGLPPTTIDITSEAQLIAGLTAHYAVATTQEITTLVATYPDDPADGSPFGTGDANNIYPEYKRFSAIFGDVTFNLMRRAYLAGVCPHITVYSYLDTFLFGTGVLGTFHSADFTIDQFPITAAVLVPQDAVLTYYTSFVNFADPNQIPSPYPTWNAYTPANTQLLNFSIGAVTYLQDDFRFSQYATIISLLSELRL